MSSSTDIATYMHDLIGPLATSLGWSVAGGSYTACVADVLLRSGEESVEVIEEAKWKALAAVSVWRRVLAHTAGDYAFEADGTQHDRNQIHEMVKANLAVAERDAWAYIAPAIERQTLRRPAGLYEPVTMEEMGLSE